MSFFEAISSVFSQYATFSGRARRSEYWYFVLFNFLVSLVLNIILMAVGKGTLATVVTVLQMLYSLAVLIPGLAVSWRRMHDIGKSGAWVFLSLIPIIGAILVIVWMCKDSQPGANAYGPNPKEYGYY